MEFALSKPITASNGDTVSVLTLDFDALTYMDLKAARKVKAFISDVEDVKTSSVTASIAPRLDEGLRIGLAWVAAVKADSRLDLNDVLKLSARDVLLLSEEAYPFFSD